MAAEAVRSVRPGFEPWKNPIIWPLPACATDAGGDDCRMKSWSEPQCVSHLKCVRAAPLRWEIYTSEMFMLLLFCCSWELQLEGGDKASPDFGGLCHSAGQGGVTWGLQLRQQALQARGGAGTRPALTGFGPPHLGRPSGGDRSLGRAPRLPQTNLLIHPHICHKHDNLLKHDTTT
jgi:hypothetical protein